MGEECRNCRFSKTTGSMLVCRRYPPAAGRQMDRDLFPVVSPGEWCGEWFRMRPNDSLPVPATPGPRPSFSHGRAKAVTVALMRRHPTPEPTS